jgi:outer membrane protein assembly factor BamD
MNLITRFLIVVFVFGVLSGCNKKTVTNILKSKDVEYKLGMAEQYYANKKYSKAQILYEDLFPLLRNDPRFEDLYYKYAYCGFYQKDYLSAENLFKGFLEVFPKSPRAAEVDYMKAFCYYKQSPRVELDQTPTQKAIGSMQAHLNNYPESIKAADARKIIDESFAKLELKEQKSAELYYNVGSYRAAAITFTTLLNNYPESKRADEYKLMIIKSYYQYAGMSIEEKQKERFTKVIEEYYDFVDRFPESGLLKEAEKYFNLSSNNLKANKNEQTNTKS